MTKPVKLRAMTNKPIDLDAISECLVWGEWLCDEDQAELLRLARIGQAVEDVPVLHIDGPEYSLNDAAARIGYYRGKRVRIVPVDEQ